jgi:hypothetical protein
MNLAVIPAQEAVSKHRKLKFEKMGEKFIGFKMPCNAFV